MTIGQHIKAPGSHLDYAIDWSDWLTEGDTITAAEWTVPEGLTKTDESATTTRATIWLSDGTAGETYRLVCTITTAQGRIDPRTLTLRCAQR